MSTVSITKEQIDRLLSQCTFTDTKMGEKTTVVCCKMPNGWEVIETSGSVDPANYNHEIGITTCKRRLVDRIWQLEGYRLQCEIAQRKAAIPGAAVTALLVVGLLCLASGAYAWDATDSAMAQQMGAAAATAALGSATTLNPITIALAVLAAIIGPGVAWISSHFHAKNTTAITNVAQAAIAAGQAANAQHGANLQTVAAAAGQAAIGAAIPAIESAVTKAVLGGQGPRPVAPGGTPWRNDAGLHPVAANPS